MRLRRMLGDAGASAVEYALIVAAVAALLLPVVIAITRVLDEVFHENCAADRHAERVDATRSRTASEAPETTAPSPSSSPCCCPCSWLLLLGIVDYGLWYSDSIALQLGCPRGRPDGGRRTTTPAAERPGTTPPRRPRAP